MTVEKRRAEALLTDHFTYTPLSLIDDVINAVNTIIYQALDALEDGLLNVPPAQLGFHDANSASQSAKDEIENGVHQLETLLENTVDKSFDKFEIWTLRNVLTVPEDLLNWVKLSQYEDLRLPLPESAANPESITLLRRKIQENRKLNIALRKRQQRDAQTVAQLRQLLSAPVSSPMPQSSTTNPSLSFLSQSTLPSTTDSDTKAAGASTYQPLNPRAEFSASQLPALRQLVSELRPRIDKLKQHRDLRTDRSALKEERRQYIEGTVRRVVEKEGLSMDGTSRDLEMLDQAATRGTEGGQGTGLPEGTSGAKKDMDEVEALETMVDAGASNATD